MGSGNTKASQTIRAVERAVKLAHSEHLAEQSQAALILESALVKDDTDTLFEHAEVYDLIEALAESSYAEIQRSVSEAYLIFSRKEEHALRILDLCFAPYIQILNSKSHDIQMRAIKIFQNFAKYNSCVSGLHSYRAVEIVFSMCFSDTYDIKIEASRAVSYLLVTEAGREIILGSYHWSPVVHLVEVRNDEYITDALKALEAITLDSKQIKQVVLSFGLMNVLLLADEEMGCLPPPEALLEHQAAEAKRLRDPSFQFTTALQIRNAVLAAWKAEGAKRTLTKPDQASEVYPKVFFNAATRTNRRKHALGLLSNLIDLVALETGEITTSPEDSDLYSHMLESSTRIVEMGGLRLFVAASTCGDAKTLAHLAHIFLCLTYNCSGQTELLSSGLLPALRSIAKAPPIALPDYSIARLDVLMALESLASRKINRRQILAEGIVGTLVSYGLDQSFKDVHHQCVVAHIISLFAESVEDHPKLVLQSALAFLSRYSLPDAYEKRIHGLHKPKRDWGALLRSRSNATMSSMLSLGSDGSGTNLLNSNRPFSADSKVSLGSDTARSVASENESVPTARSNGDETSRSTGVPTSRSFASETTLYTEVPRSWTARELKRTKKNAQKQLEKQKERRCALYLSQHDVGIEELCMLWSLRGAMFFVTNEEYTRSVLAEVDPFRFINLFKSKLYVFRQAAMRALSFLTKNVHPWATDLCVAVDDKFSHVFDFLKDKDNNARAKFYALDLVGNMVFCEAIGDQVMTRTGIAFFIDFILQERANPFLKSRCLQIIAEISNLGQFEFFKEKRSFIEFLLTELQSSSNTAEFFGYVSEILYNFSSEGETADILLSCQVEEFLKLFLTTRDDKVQRDALLMLANMLVYEDMDGRYFRSEESLQVLLAFFMRCFENTESAHIQHEIIRTAHAFFEFDYRCKVFGYLFGSPDFVRLFVSRAKTVTDTQLLHQAVEIIAHLAAKESTALELVSYGALGTVMHALERSVEEESGPSLLATPGSSTFTTPTTTPRTARKVKRLCKEISLPLKDDTARHFLMQHSFDALFLFLRFYDFPSDVLTNEQVDTLIACADCDKVQFKDINLEAAELLFLVSKKHDPACQVQVLQCWTPIKFIDWVSSDKGMHTELVLIGMELFEMFHPKLETECLVYSIPRLIQLAVRMGSPSVFYHVFRCFDDFAYSDMATRPLLSEEEVLSTAMDLCLASPQDVLGYLKYQLIESLVLRKQMVDSRQQIVEGRSHHREGMLGTIQDEQAQRTTLEGRLKKKLQSRIIRQLEREKEKEAEKEAEERRQRENEEKAREREQESSSDSEGVKDGEMQPQDPAVEPIQWDLSFQGLADAAQSVAASLAAEREEEKAKDPKWEAIGRGTFDLAELPEEPLLSESESRLKSIVIERARDVAERRSRQKRPSSAEEAKRLAQVFTFTRVSSSVAASPASASEVQEDPGSISQAIQQSAAAAAVTAEVTVEEPSGRSRLAAAVRAAADRRKQQIEMQKAEYELAKMEGLFDDLNSSSNRLSRMASRLSSKGSLSSKSGLEFRTKSALLRKLAEQQQGEEGAMPSLEARARSALLLKLQGGQSNSSEEGSARPSLEARAKSALLKRLSSGDLSSEPESTSRPLSRAKSQLIEKLRSGSSSSLGVSSTESEGEMSEGEPGLPQSDTFPDKRNVFKLRVKTVVAVNKFRKKKADAQTSGDAAALASPTAQEDVAPPVTASTSTTGRSLFRGTIRTLPSDRSPQKQAPTEGAQQDAADAPRRNSTSNATKPPQTESGEEGKSEQPVETTTVSLEEIFDTTSSALSTVRESLPQFPRPMSAKFKRPKSAGPTFSTSASQLKAGRRLQTMLSLSQRPYSAGVDRTRTTASVPGLNFWTLDPDVPPIGSAAGLTEFQSQFFTPNGVPAVESAKSTACKSPEPEDEMTRVLRAVAAECEGTPPPRNSHVRFTYPLEIQYHCARLLSALVEDPSYTQRVTSLCSPSLIHRVLTSFAQPLCAVPVEWRPTDSAPNVGRPMQVVSSNVQTECFILLKHLSREGDTPDDVMEAFGVAPMLAMRAAVVPPEFAPLRWRFDQSLAEVLCSMAERASLYPSFEESFAELVPTLSDLVSPKGNFANLQATFHTARALAALSAHGTFKEAYRELGGIQNLIALIHVTPDFVRDPPSFVAVKEEEEAEGGDLAILRMSAQQGPDVPKALEILYHAVRTVSFLSFSLECTGPVAEASGVEALLELEEFVSALDAHDSDTVSRIQNEIAKALGYLALDGSLTGHLSTTGAVAQVFEYAKSPNIEMQWCACKCITNLGPHVPIPPGAVPTLYALLVSRDPFIRQLAVKAVRQILDTPDLRLELAQCSRVDGMKVLLGKLEDYKPIRELMEQVFIEIPVPFDIWEECSTQTLAEWLVPTRNLRLQRKMCEVLAYYSHFEDRQVAYHQLGLIARLEALIDIDDEDFYVHTAAILGGMCENKWVRKDLLSDDRFLQLLQRLVGLSSTRCDDNVAHAILGISVEDVGKDFILDHGFFEFLIKLIQQPKHGHSDSVRREIAQTLQNIAIYNSTHPGFLSEASVRFFFGLVTGGTSDDTMAKDIAIILLALSPNLRERVLGMGLLDELMSFFSSVRSVDKPYLPIDVSISISFCVLVSNQSFVLGHVLQREFVRRFIVRPKADDLAIATAKLISVLAANGSLVPALVVSPVVHDSLRHGLDRLSAPPAAAAASAAGPLPLPAQKLQLMLLHACLHMTSRDNRSRSALSAGISGPSFFTKFLTARVRAYQQQHKRPHRPFSEDLSGQRTHPPPVPSSELKETVYECSIIAHACAILANIAEIDPAGCIAAGAIDAIFSLARYDCGRTLMSLREMCRVLRTLCLHDRRLVDDLLQRGGVPLCLYALEVFIRPDELASAHSTVFEYDRDLHSQTQLAFEALSCLSMLSMTDQGTQQICDHFNGLLTLTNMLAGDAQVTKPDSVLRQRNVNPKYIVRDLEADLKPGSPSPESRPHSRAKSPNRMLAMDSDDDDDEGRTSFGSTKSRLSRSRALAQNGQQGSPHSPPMAPLENDLEVEELHSARGNGDDDRPSSVPSLPKISNKMKANLVATFLSSTAAEAEGSTSSSIVKKATAAPTTAVVGKREFKHGRSAFRKYDPPPLDSGKYHSCHLCDHGDEMDGGHVPDIGVDGRPLIHDFVDVVYVEERFQQTGVESEESWRALVASIEEIDRADRLSGRPPMPGTQGQKLVRRMVEMDRILRRRFMRQIEDAWQGDEYMHDVAVPDAAGAAQCLALHILANVTEKEERAQRMCRSVDARLDVFLPLVHARFLQTKLQAFRVLHNLSGNIPSLPAIFGRPVVHLEHAYGPENIFLKKLRKRFLPPVSDTAQAGGSGQPSSSSSSSFSPDLEAFYPLFLSDLELNKNFRSIIPELNDRIQRWGADPNPKLLREAFEGDRMPLSMLVEFLVDDCELPARFKYLVAKALANLLIQGVSRDFISDDDIDVLVDLEKTTKDAMLQMYIRIALSNFGMDTAYRQRAVDIMERNYEAKIVRAAGGTVEEPTPEHDGDPELPAADDGSEKSSESGSSRSGGVRGVVLPRIPIKESLGGSSKSPLYK